MALPAWLRPALAAAGFAAGTVAAGGAARGLAGCRGGSRRCCCHRRRSWSRPGACRFSGRFLGLRFGLGGGLCGGFGFGATFNFLTNFYRDVFRNGTRVSLLFRDAIAGQKVDDGLGFDFQLAGQLVNTDLICFAQDLASSGCSVSPWADSEAPSVAVACFDFSEFVVVESADSALASSAFPAVSLSGDALASASAGASSALVSVSAEVSEVPSATSSCTCSPSATVLQNLLCLQPRHLLRWHRCFAAAFVEAIHGLINLVDHFFADAGNFHQLLGSHGSQRFDVVDAGGFHLFDGLGADAGERSERRSGRGETRHLVFDFAALFFFALDVDIPADELAGQPNVLTFFADGERELRVFDDDFELVSLRDQ